MSRRSCLSSGLGLPLFDFVDAPEGYGFQDFDARFPFARVIPSESIASDASALLGQSALRCRSNPPHERVEFVKVSHGEEIADATIEAVAAHTGLTTNIVRLHLRALAVSEGIARPVKLAGPNGSVTLRLH